MMRAEPAFQVSQHAVYQWDRYAASYYVTGSSAVTLSGCRCLSRTVSHPQLHTSSQSPHTILAGGHLCFFLHHLKMQTGCNVLYVGLSHAYIIKPSHNQRSHNQNTVIASSRPLASSKESDDHSFGLYKSQMVSIQATIELSKHKTFCIRFVGLQCWGNVKDVVPTFCKCYTNVLCLVGGMQFLECFYSIQTPLWTF